MSRLRRVIVFGALLGFSASSLLGCSGTDVPLAPAPPVQPGPTKELPKDPKQGGGPGSSGNMKFNPGANS